MACGGGAAADRRRRASTKRVPVAACSGRSFLHAVFLIAVLQGHALDAAGRQFNRGAVADSADHGARQQRKLQQQTTPNCAQTECADGLVHTNETALAVGSDAGTSCCICPAGTYAAYADQHLALRFRSEGITTAPDGSLLWNAEYPSSMAFTNRRLGESDADYPTASADQWYNFDNHTEPSVHHRSDGRLSGMHFESEPGKTFKQIMYANQKVALGAKNTAFFVVTPGRSTAVWGALLMFRPGGVPGGASWLMATGYGCEGGCLAVCAGTVTGYEGPFFQPETMQIAIWRSDKQFNALGSFAPVSSMAVMSMEPPFHLNFEARLQMSGLTQYHVPGRPEEVFDYDFRDPTVDGWHSYAAGYMMLGHHSLAYPEGLQFHGIIHAIEIHRTTLSDDSVVDVARALVFATVPNVSTPLACVQCSPGRIDRDLDQSTECDLCGTGRYTSVNGAIVCAGECGVGTTTLHLGSTTNLNCSACPPGKYGAPQGASRRIVCDSCPPGRIGTETAASSIAICEACPPGASSTAGATACAPSGCTDDWALNFDVGAAIDDGSCVYSCASLLIQAGYTPSGRCLIYTHGAWKPHFSNGSLIDEGALIHTGMWNSNPETFVVPQGSAWVIQGKPLAGSVVAERSVRSVASDFTPYDSNLPILGNATVRFVSISAQADGTKPLAEQYAVLVDHRDDAAAGDGSALAKRLVFAHAYFADNVQSEGVTQGNLLVIRGMDIHMRNMTFAGNKAHYQGGGADFIAGRGLNALLTHVYVSQNDAQLYGGGVSCFGPGKLRVAFSVLVENSARQGGAIAVGAAAEGIITYSLFARNVARVTGGGIAAILAGVDLESCRFESNDAISLGAAVHIDQPPRVKIMDTTFSPYRDGAGIVFIGGRLAGCDEHPCDPGYSCSYAQYSLQCTSCPEGQMSTDGMQCSACPAGEQTNSPQSGCVPCSGNTFSTSGRCLPCFGTAIDGNKQCQACPLNQVADPPEDGCRCETSYYNASAGPLLCFGRDEPFDGRLTQAPKPTDPNLFCQECPSDCVDCTYTGYAGKPILNQGYASPTTSAADWFEQIPRVVFECPVDRDACLAEAPPIHNGSVTVQPSDKVCKAGYRGILCTMCADGYSLGSVGCDECEKLTPASAVSLVVLLSVVIGGITHLSRSLRKIGGSRKLRLIIALIPELIGDFKVFIGLYQVLCSMGPTLEITYPAAVERFVNAIRGFSNFDIFSIPGLSCTFGSTVFGKFWVAVFMPPLIATAFYLVYLYKQRMAKQHVSDVVLDEVADQCWEEAQEMTAAAHKNEHTENGWTKQGQLTAKDMDKDSAAAKIQSAYRGYAHRKSTGDDGGGMPRFQIRNLMLKRAVQLALARQNCIGWAFLMIFLVYPSTCANLLAVFHCFEVDEITAHITADFRQLCSGSWYELHYYTALVFSFLYPIGIPVGVGVIIFRHREEIKSGVGPSQFERLYHDYKPDHCLWEIYQLLQKVTLVGFLGFFHRGSFVQVVMGLFVTEVFLLAFIKTMPYNDFRTNVLAIGSQTILVFSYFCTILLKLEDDVKGPYITANAVSTVMVGINVPLGLYFLYDIAADVQEHFGKLREEGLLQPDALVKALSADNGEEHGALVKALSADDGEEQDSKASKYLNPMALE